MSRYTVNEDGTYTDTQTGLQWQAESHGPMTWQEAMDYAKSLGDGWRLPTLQELISFMDCTLADPATELPGMKSSNYWSSSTYAYYLSFAWSAYFGYGSVDGNDKTNGFHVRCVRNAEG